MVSGTKRHFILVSAILAVFLLAGCAKGGSGAAKDKEASRTLVIALPEEIEGSDLHQINWENVVHGLMYEPLVAYDLKQKNLLPAAAESFSVSEDGKAITFKLRKDACFANGDSMTAAEVVASYKRYKEISPYSSDLDPVTEMIVQDPQTLVLKLDSPAAFLWPVLGSTYGGVVNVKKAEEAGKEAFNRQGIGNGPYLLKEWVQGSHVTLVKNPRYRTSYAELSNKGASPFDTVTIRFIADNFTRISELEAGNVDLAVNVPIESLETLKKNESVQLHAYMQNGIDFIFMNVKNPHLSNLKVRQAMALAVDREELKKALKDTVDIRYGIVSPAQICYDESVEAELKALYGYNLEKAKSLLAEAGYKDSNADGIVEKGGKPLSLTMMVALDNPYLKQSAPIIQAQLKKIGVDLQLREYEVKYIKQMIKEHNYDMATRFYWWSDPDIFYYVFHSEAKFVWSNPEVDKLLDEGRYIMDPAARTAKYAEVQRKVLGEMPIITLYSEYQYMATGKKTKGLKVGISGTPYLNDMVKE